MASPLTVENGLILACARTAPDVERIQTLAERGPDWQVILRKAERWGLVPLVYTHLRQAIQSSHVPKPVAERLRPLYHRDTIHGVARRELLRVTLLRFAEANIPVIVLKGAALATLVYPSPALRPMKDIDLLVQRHDLDKVESVFRSMRDAPPNIPSLGSEGLSLLDVRHDIFSSNSSADGRPAATSIAIEDFWARARPVQIESVPTLVFSPEDLLLHLAFHLISVNGFVGQVRTLCDIGEVCRRYGKALEWRQLVARAHAYDIGKQLYYASRLSREIVGADVPSGVLRELRASFGQLPLEERFIATIARQAIVSEKQAIGMPWTFYKLGMRLLATRRAGESVTVVYHHLARAYQTRIQRLTTRIDSRPSHGTSSADSESSSRTQQTTAHPTFQGERSSRSQGEVAVTYDQNASDGLGAQLQRIYGLYALSRALGIKYVHSPLGQVDYQGLMPLLAGRTDPDFTTRYNTFFSLPSDDFDLDGCERLLVRSPNEKQVEHYRQYAAETRRSVLLQAHEPYAHTDRHPEAYRALCTVSPYRNFRPVGPIRVCIHMRRGDRVLAQDPRLLPNAYYLRVCSTVVNALQQQRAPFVVRLHTEMPQQPRTVHPDHAGLFIRLDKPSTIDPATHALEDFEVLPNLEKVLNVGPQEALNDFATADVLILSLSCFGYVGGLLNPHGLVIAGPNLPSPRNFHTALPDWLVAEENGNVDATQVATRIATQLRHRG